MAAAPPRPLRFTKPGLAFRPDPPAIRPRPGAAAALRQQFALVPPGTDAVADKYKELEQRRRRAQISARRALEREEDRKGPCRKLPFAG